MIDHWEGYRDKMISMTTKYEVMNVKGDRMSSWYFPMAAALEACRLIDLHRSEFFVRANIGEHLFEMPSPREILDYERARQNPKVLLPPGPFDCVYFAVVAGSDKKAYLCDRDGSTCTFEECDHRVPLRRSIDPFAHRKPGHPF